MTITKDMITKALESGQTHKQILEQIDLALRERPMLKVAINKCYGGYSISEELAKRAGLDSYDRSTEARTNPVVIEAVESDSESASGDCASLVVVSVPCDAHWWIDEYDGIENVCW